MPRKIPHRGDDYLEMVAEIVKAARASTGKTQRVLADEVGTSQNHIYMIENKLYRNGPRVSLLARIARACGGRLKLTIEKG